MAIAFPVGPIKGAALTVLSCDDPVTTKVDTRYFIRYACCGREVTMVHRTIVRRLLEGLTLCRVCGSAKGLANLAKNLAYKEEEARQIQEREETLASLVEPKLPYGFVVPPWPRPSFSVPMFLREREYYHNQC